MTHSNKLISDHVSDPPTLVVKALLERGQKVFLDFVRVELLSDSSESGHSEEPDRVLVVRGKLSVDWNDLGKEKGVVIGKVLGERLRQCRRVERKESR